MKRTLLTLAALLAATTAHAAERYTLDPNHTNVVWHANHLGFSYPSGKLVQVEGEFMLDEVHPENSSVKATIYPASVMTGLPKFDEHLRNEDFFNAGKYPTATFVSRNVKVTGENTADIIGDLTLLGVTKPVTLKARLNKIGEHIMTKKKAAGFSAETVIKRSDFGMNYGLPAVGDDVLVTIEAEGNIAE